MERLIQKYIKYFYSTLIGFVALQLLSTVISTIQGTAKCNTFVLIFLSIMNIILLVSSLLHNVRQQFTECKINAKILRLTLAVLIRFTSVDKLL